MNGGTMDEPVAETAAGGTPAAPNLGTGHKKKAIEAASFVVVGFGLSQVIRLAGNILVTRLLVPEAFGIIAIARVFFMCIGFFLDIGLDPAIIRSKRAHDPLFLNTAWTLQVTQNAILALLACLIGYPVSLIYNEPILVFLVPCVGLIGFLDGFKSTYLAVLGKELQQKKLTIMELIIQVVSLAIMLLMAYIMRSVWALLFSDLVGGLIRVAWSHVLNKEQPNKFVIERPAAKELLGFGKWIMFSTAMTFLASQSDRILLGKLFNMGWLGVYGVAVSLADLPKQVLAYLNSKVIYPLITKYAHLSNSELREKMQKPRGLLLLSLAALLAVFVSFSDLAVNILYDQRYHSAAWILPILAIGMWPLILRFSNEGCLLAIGKPMYSAFGNLSKFIYLIVALPLAKILGGDVAVVVAVALGDLPAYIIQNVGLVKERLALLRQDGIMTVVFVLATGLLVGIRVVAGLGLPGQATLFLR
jgi:O-antigen/teichoic acid export membrane protein